MRRKMLLFSTVWIAFAAGVATTLAAKKAFEPGAFYAGKEPKEAAAALLARAEQLAGGGSWERIGVGRVHYLAGDKAKGQQLFDLAIAKKAEASDLYRIATVYALANECDKAKPLFQQAAKVNLSDDTLALEAASWMNICGDRELAETYFRTAFDKNPSELWHYINAAGSYLGQPPF